MERIDPSSYYCSMLGEARMIQTLEPDPSNLKTFIALLIEELEKETGQDFFSLMAEFIKARVHVERSEKCEK